MFKKCYPVILIIMIPIVLFSAVSCTDSEPIDINLNLLYNELMEKTDLPELTDVTENYIETIYYVKDIHVNQIVVMVALPGSFGEIFMCEAADGEAKDFIIQRLNAYKAQQLKSLENYENLPDVQKQWLSFDRSEVIVKGNYIFYIVLDNEAPVIDAINNYINISTKK